MLKQVITIWLILTYCLIIFDDFAPQLIYKINFDYIVKNLCEQKDAEENLCMGHCFLNKKIKQEAEKNSKSTSANTNLKNLEFHFAAEKYIKLDIPDIQTDKNSYYTHGFPILTNNFKPLLPPPKLLFS